MWLDFQSRQSRSPVCSLVDPPRCSVNEDEMFWESQDETIYEIEGREPPGPGDENSPGRGAQDGSGIVELHAMSSSTERQTVVSGMDWQVPQPVIRFSEIATRPQQAAT